MKKQDRPFVPTLDELQTILNIENPGDLPDAVRDLLEQNAALMHGLEKTRDLVDELGKQIEAEKRWGIDALPT